MHVIDEQQPVKKSKWPNIIASLFVLVSVGVALYLVWQTYSLDKSQAELTLAIETQKENLINLEKQQQIGNKKRAVELLRKAQNYRTNWSTVLADLNEELFNDAPIEFNTVNFSNGNEVQVAGTVQDFLVPARFLMAVKQSNKFENAFISRISPAGSAEGQGVSYRFNATFNYVPESKNTDN